MNLKLKIIALYKSSQIRYLISGSIFTVIGPSLFILTSSIVNPRYAILFSEIITHFLRFHMITLWVFQTKINNSSFRAYIKATIPLLILNFIIVNIFISFLGTIRTALITAFFSATIGYLWNKYCYLKTSKTKSKKSMDGLINRQEL